MDSCLVLFFADEGPCELLSSSAHGWSVTKSCAGQLSISNEVYPSDPASVVRGQRDCCCNPLRGSMQAVPHAEWKCDAGRVRRRGGGVCFLLHQCMVGSACQFSTHIDINISGATSWARGNEQQVGDWAECWDRRRSAAFQGQRAHRRAQSSATSIPRACQHLVGCAVVLRRSRHLTLFGRPG